MTTISLNNLSKSFGTATAVSDICLELPSGSFTALLGPSGCGKTTMLRLIAGFEQPDQGSVSFDGVSMAGPGGIVPPEKRQLGIVFQSYALWPHMNVAANVAYPLQGKGLHRAEIEQRVAEALDVVSLNGYQDRSVDALSGGQRQRVALARCLVTGTRIILLDEPLANLDVHLRAAMLDVFAEVHQRSGATIVFVTHDQSEALALADRIVVLDQGRIQQMGAPERIYAEPANAMVAGFVGRGMVVDAIASGGIVRIGERTVPARGAGEGPLKLLVRPQAIRRGEGGLAATALQARYTGASFETTVELAGGGRLLADLHERLPAGTQIELKIDDAWIVPSAREVRPRASELPSDQATTTAPPPLSP